MSELDLTEAIEAAARALWDWTINDDILIVPAPWVEADPDERQRCVDAVRVAMEAAAPLIERQVREKVAQAIEVAGGERCPTCGLGTHLRNGPQFWCQNNHMWRGWVRVSADSAAVIARGGQP